MTGKKMLKPPVADENSFQSCTWSLRINDDFEESSPAEKAKLKQTVTNKNISIKRSDIMVSFRFRCTSV